MTMPNFTALTPYRNIFLTLSIFGLFIPNGIFIYYLFINPTLVFETMLNPIAFVFIFEAFFIMFLLMFMINKLGLVQPGPYKFFIYSIVGSLFFSIPFTIYRYISHQSDVQNTI
ncbi:hypothetical protein BVY03_00670 [bacterium K02(2017)]|nr:hypothetical protein BVY03_00670 [bacterium K02(2017)]